MERRISPAGIPFLIVRAPGILQPRCSRRWGLLLQVTIPIAWGGRFRLRSADRLQDYIEGDLLATNRLLPPCRVRPPPGRIRRFQPPALQGTAATSRNATGAYCCMVLVRANSSCSLWRAVYRAPAIEPSIGHIPAFVTRSRNMPDGCIRC